MTRTIQSRVIALVGAGVFAAGALLTLLSRSALLDLDAALRDSQLRLATTIAASISDDVLSEEQLLQGIADAPFVDPADGDDGPERRALAVALRHTRFASGLCFVSAAGAAGPCEPVSAQPTLSDPRCLSAVRSATAAGRPLVTSLLPAGAGVFLVVLPWHPERGSDWAVVGAVSSGDRRLTAALRGSARLVDDSGHDLAGVAVGGRRVVDAPVDGTPWIVRAPAATEAATNALAGFRTTSLWLAPVLAGIAMLLGWGVAGSVRRPVAALVSAAERIAAGDLSRPIEPGPLDEIGRLSAAVEEMRVRLEASRAEQQAWSAELERRVADRTRELRRLTRQVISAQEEERRRVARELHDETSQLIASLAMRLDALAGRASAEERSHLGELRTLVERMHRGLHRVIVNLRPSVLDDLGLAAAIESLAREQLAAAGVAVRCELRDLRDLRLPSEVETAAFRIVQETIANIARHAEADTVLIQGSTTDGQVALEIEDDGRGFDPAGVSANSTSLRGVGLMGMRERAALIGGSIEIDSAPGRGTRVRVLVPVREEVLL